VRVPYRLIGSFKGLLFVAAVAVVLGVMIYTDRMVSDLRESSRRHLSLKVERFRMLFEKGNDEELDLYLTEMAAKDFPLIVADSAGNPTSWSGLPDLDRLSYPAAVLKARGYQRAWLNQGNQPVMLEVPEHGLNYYYYYGDSDQIQRLRLMPWIEIGVVGGLILIGYLGFVSIKKSEERSVWVGMARETAHQLGTPISSLMGWVELLEERSNDPVLRQELVRDLQRLKTVADRFQRIGSQTSLSLQPLEPLISDAVAYIRRRVPHTQGYQMDISQEVEADLAAKVDPTLLSWVVENLLKNGVEALKGKSGKVSVRAYSQGKHVLLEVSDDGSGIPRADWRNVFRPGYTTKERGWGLGLSLAKRIIVDVHDGRIFVLNSNPDTGTIIRVELKT